MALVTALMAMLMMLAIGAGITLNSTTETAIAAHHRDALQALHAAEAGIDLTASRLRTIPDWSALASDPSGTTFVQGGLAALLQADSVDPRVIVTVTVYPDPNGQPDTLTVRSTASGAAGIRRTIQVTIRRTPPADGASLPRIETVSWRER